MSCPMDWWRSRARTRSSWQVGVVRHLAGGTGAYVCGLMKRPRPSLLQALLPCPQLSCRITTRYPMHAARGLYYDMWRMQRAQAVLEEHLAAEEAQHRQQSGGSSGTVGGAQHPAGLGGAGSEVDSAAGSIGSSSGGAGGAVQSGSGSSSEEEGPPAALQEAGRQG